MLKKDSNIKLKIILVVGPSGAGKDSLLLRCRQALADRRDIIFVPRYVTRKPDSNEQKYYVDQRAFSALKLNGFFFVHWQAYGNSYGIGVDPLLEEEKTAAIISVSRTVIPIFEMAFNDVQTLLITAPNTMLHERLEKRGRESATDMSSRFIRMGMEVSARKLSVFDNSGSLDKTAPVFIKLVEKLIASPCSSRKVEKSRGLPHGLGKEAILSGDS